MMNSRSAAIICVFSTIVSGFLFFAPISHAQDEDFPFKVPADPSNLPETALIETSKGPFEIRFFRKLATISVANFVHLGQKGIYEGLSFHRYVPGFVIQGGDPTGTGKGGPGWTLPAEISSELHHVHGSIGWARIPAERNPGRRSNGSQFYITLRPAPDLDGFYTVFAQVIRGMQNVDRLRAGDKIVRVRFPMAQAAQNQK